MAPARQDDAPLEYGAVDMPDFATPLGAMRSEAHRLRNPEEERWHDWSLRPARAAPKPLGGARHHDDGRGASLACGGPRGHGACASRLAKVLVALALVTGPLAYASAARGRVANVADPTVGRAADAAGAEPDLFELRNATDAFELRNATFANASSPSPHYIRRGR